jgi:hypothetical protein
MSTRLATLARKYAPRDLAVSLCKKYLFWYLEQRVYDPFIYKNIYKNIYLFDEEDEKHRENRLAA